jgi:hypothetical protein
MMNGLSSEDSKLEKGEDGREKSPTEAPKVL